MDTPRILLSKETPTIMEFAQAFNEEALESPAKAEACCAKTENVAGAELAPLQISPDEVDKLHGKAKKGVLCKGVLDG